MVSNVPGPVLPALLRRHGAARGLSARTGDRRCRARTSRCRATATHSSSASTRAPPPCRTCRASSAAMVDELVSAEQDGAGRARRRSTAASAAPSPTRRGRRTRARPRASARRFRSGASRSSPSGTAQLSLRPGRAAAAARPGGAERAGLGQGGPVQRSDLEGDPGRGRALAAQQAPRVGRAGGADRRGRGVPRGQRRGLARLPGH